MLWHIPWEGLILTRECPSVTECRAAKADGYRVGYFFVIF